MQSVDYRTQFGSLQQFFFFLHHKKKRFMYSDVLSHFTQKNHLLYKIILEFWGLMQKMLLKFHPEVCLNTKGSM